MVALNHHYVVQLAGPGRLGFIATNGLHDCAVIDEQQQDEYRARLREGWRVVEVRPICRSLNPKLIHTHPDLLKARAFSYSLVILEHPGLTNAEVSRAVAAESEQQRSPRG